MYGKSEFYAGLIAFGLAWHLWGFETAACAYLMLYVLWKPNQ